MMGYLVVSLIGFVSGAVLVFFLLEKKRKLLADQQVQMQAEAKLLHARQVEVYSREQQYAQLQQAYLLSKEQFDKQVITYGELVQENIGLKNDLNNLHQQLRKNVLDHSQSSQQQILLDNKVNELGIKYLRDQTKWILTSLNPNNYALSKSKLEEAISRLREIGLPLSAQEERDRFAELKKEYELVVRAAFEKEEQARIRAQIKEEQKVERELQRALEQAEREKRLIETALAEAMVKAHGEHTAEIEQLKAKLAEAEAKSARAVSQAQLTKSGNVYVISNIGSFGESVFKIGMTRRLEPLDRIHELGDASVPFPFDVHMMIATDDAPSLENALHKAFHKRRLNRVNLRKEFFRVGLQEIVNVVKKHHGEVTYQADAEALQYRNSLATTDEDLENLEAVIEDDEPLVSVVMADNE